MFPSVNRSGTNEATGNAAGRLAFRVLCAILILFPLKSVVALTNNLALTPPMGWNDWYTYRCGISESVVGATADTMVANGMKAAGYQFVSIDDCWQVSRDSNGVIVADPTRFPDGMKFLADYVHSDGLKLGLYTARGTQTCQREPGSYGCEYLDASTYAGWGVDFLKDDACVVPVGDNAQSDYFRMSDGLMKSGRPMVFSICNPASGYEYWSPNLGNMWRTTGDTSATFTNVMSHIDANSLAAYRAGRGRWNDPDILQIGMGDFTSLIPAQTQFSMWCIMAAPLIAGNDLTSMSAQTLSVLTNAEAIAVDQDPAGEQATWAGGIQDAAEVWSKPLGYDFTTRAVALLNRSTTTAANITCVWTNLGLQAGTATARDLWTQTNLGTFTNSFATNVPPEGVVFLKVIGTPVPPPGTGTNYLGNLQPIYAYVSSNGVWVRPAENKNIGGQTMKLNGQAYNEGIGVTTTSGLEYNLGGRALRFQSDIGVDDQEGANGSVIFQVFADGTKIYDSGIMTGGTAKQSLNLDVTGVRRLTLGVSDAINNSSGRSIVSTANYADWANALVIATNAPQMPETPTGLTASPGNAITLDWNPTLAALTYNVKRATVHGGPYTTIANVPNPVFTDSNVVEGTTYDYVVSAVSSLGEGSNSTEVSASPCNVPVPPANVMAAGSNSQITVSWSASAGATSYSVYRFTADTPPVLIGSGITTTHFTDTGLGDGVTNYYFITAANACNQSGWSTFAAGITASQIPAAPTGLVALPVDSKVSLRWIAPPGSAAFNVKRSTTNGGPYVTIASNVSNAGYFDSGVVIGTTYFYVVSALNAAGEGPNSAQVSITPFTPEIVYSNSFNGGAVDINGAAPTYASDLAGGSGSALWDVVTNNFTSGFYADKNGTLGPQQNTALLPFAPQPGYVYTLSGSITFTGNPGSWVAMGFGANMPASNQLPPGQGDRFNDPAIDGNPWSLFRPGTGNSGVQLYYSRAGLVGSQVLIPTTFPNTDTISMVLDTSSAHWVISESVNGTLVTANYAYSANPTITSIGYGQTTLTAGTYHWNILTLSIAPLRLTLANQGGNQAVVNWNYGTLQTATNVTGPYVDMTNVVQPYTIPFSNSQQFFRLKKN
jgi:alpha-galactosidase